MGFFGISFQPDRRNNYGAHDKGFLTRALHPLLSIIGSPDIALYTHLELEAAVTSGVSD
jgi:hypothetical protein